MYGFFRIIAQHFVGKIGVIETSTAARGTLFAAPMVTTTRWSLIRTILAI